MGRGGILCSQWLLTQRFDVEPLAGVLLQRIFDYCTSPAGHLALRPAALLADTNGTAAAKLAELELLAENFQGRLTNCSPALYPILFVAGGDAAWQEAGAQLSTLADYVGQGGKLVLHRPSNAFLAAAQPVLFPELDVSEASLGMVLRRDKTNAVVRLANHDLYWIGQPGTWNAPEVVSTNIARRYYRKRFNLAYLQHH